MLHLLYLKIIYNHYYNYWLAKASILKISFGQSSVRIIGPFSVIKISSSIRTAKPTNSGGANWFLGLTYIPK